MESYAERVAPIKGLLVDLNGFFHDLTSRYQWTWKPTSPAALELRNPDFGDRSGGPESPFRYGYESARMRLLAAQDHLQATNLLIVTPPNEPLVFALAPLTRAAMEAAARAYWLAQPDLHPRERAIRHLAERMESLHWIASLKMPGAKDEGRARIRRLREMWGDQVAIQPKTSKKEWQVGGRRTPTWTKLVGECLSGEDPLGQVLYQHAAALSHGSPGALVHNVRPIDPDGELHALSLSEQDVAVYVCPATRLFLRAVGAICVAFQWTSRANQQAIAELTQRSDSLLSDALNRAGTRVHQAD